MVVIEGDTLYLRPFGLGHKHVSLVGLSVTVRHNSSQFDHGDL